MSGLWRFRNVTGRYFGEGLYFIKQKKLLKKTYSVVVVAAVNEGWFISFVRTILKFGRRMN